MSLTTYSQVPTLNSKGDTVLCFSIDQAKYLAKEHYRADAYFKSDSICNLESKKKDLTIKMYEKIEARLQTVVGNQKTILNLKEDELKQVNLKLENANKEIKKQKFYKLVYIIVGGSLSGYIGYKYITK
jgi:hypothetical protein